jgi:hypothetical protein
LLLATLLLDNTEEEEVKKIKIYKMWLSSASGLDEQNRAVVFVDGLNSSQLVRLLGADGGARPRGFMSENSSHNSLPPSSLVSPVAGRATMMLLLPPSPLLLPLKGLQLEGCVKTAATTMRNSSSLAMELHGRRR